MAEKARLDWLLVRQGYFSSRQRAAAAVMAGQVRVDGKKVEKPGTRIDPGVQLDVQGEEHPYVSRGGVKLERALGVFEPPVEGKIALDVGASTGGFTHCLLLRGASRVYALDVGYGQLAWELRQDPRVVVLERVNVRHLQSGQIPEPVQLATVDVSFISLELVFPALTPCLAAGSYVLALVKPQFEAGKASVGKGGVVRSPEVQEQVLRQVWQSAAATGLRPVGVDYSPVAGPSGNLEFWLCARREEKGQLAMTGPGDGAFAEVVRAAWQQVLGRDAAGD